MIHPDYQSYSGKTLCITAVDGQRLTGLYYGYTPALDNEDERETIEIRASGSYKGCIYSLSLDEIAKIEIVY